MFNKIPLTKYKYKWNLACPYFLSFTSSSSSVELKSFWKIEKNKRHKREENEHVPVLRLNCDYVNIHIDYYMLRAWYRFY